MIQDAFRGAPLGTTVILIHPDAKWAPGLPIAAARLLGERKERDRFVRLVFPADAQAAWQWRDEKRRSLARQALPRIREVSLLPWPIETVQRWAEETGIPDGRDEIGRARLRQASGGFGPSLELLAGAPMGVGQDMLAASVGLLTRGGHMPLGDWPGTAHRALRAVAMLVANEEDFDADELSTAADLPREDALRVLDWAEWLGVVHASVPGRYRLNTLVARLLLDQPP